MRPEYNKQNRQDQYAHSQDRAVDQEAFAPFGDVIETAGSDYFMINNGSTRRYHKLATVETAQPEDNAIISIFSAEKLEMPLRIRMLERHPLGSQAFIPLLGNPFLVGAPPWRCTCTGLVRAFLTNGRQGVNYHRGVWHHPVLTIESGMTSWWSIAAVPGTTATHFSPRTNSSSSTPNQTKRGPAAGPPARARGTRLWKHISSNG